MTGSKPGVSQKPARESVPTPLFAKGECVVLVDPSPSAQLFVVEVAVSMNLRPIVTTRVSLVEAATANRPLVIVIEDRRLLDSLKDVAVSVGAQVVLLQPRDSGHEVRERITLAAAASRLLRQTQH